MFSARVALSTVALILAALASANPVQQAVLDDVATDDAATTVYCDGLTTIAFPKAGYKPVLERVEGGTNACVYDFLPGWPHTTGATVGKTPIAHEDWPSKPGSEAWVLNEIGELYAHTHDAMERDWIVMKKQPGQWLTKTTQYKNLAPKVATCRKFFQDVYTAVYLNARNYIAQFGCAHAGKTEMNEANVLFEFDGANHPTAHLIDWAGADCSNSNKPSAVSRARSLCADYVYNTGGPLEDCGGQFTYNQAYVFCMNLK